jgi:uncharacterized protein YbbC (DUF1343 family)
MLCHVDVVVFDLQDLGARPYTYVATLRELLLAADAHGKEVIVADRPIPLRSAPDGPVTRPGFASFVAAIPAPMLYAMTPGETALWLRDALALKIPLRVAAMSGYDGAGPRGADWPPWVPPSPGIVSWESAQCYTATVFCEAMPAIDHGRNSGLSFQLLGAPWLRAPALLERLADGALAGVAFHAHRYIPRSGPYAGRALDGVRLSVTDPRRFRPVRTSIFIVSALQALHGRRRLWRGAGARPEFFDKLYGGDDTRRALQDGAAPEAIAAAWRGELRAFQRLRRKHALYGP